MGRIYLSMAHSKQQGERLVSCIKFTSVSESYVGQTYSH